MLPELFLVFIFIGAFSFGGGNAMFPLLSKELVQIHGWLTQRELIDLFAFAQMTPGPVATNAATFVGYKLGGLPGAVLATIGVSLPSAVVMLAIIRFMVTFRETNVMRHVLAGLRPVVVALILSAGIIIAGQSVHDAAGYLLIIGNIIAVTYLDINPILLIIASGLLGLVLY